MLGAGYIRRSLFPPSRSAQLSNPSQLHYTCYAYKLALYCQAQAIYTYSTHTHTTHTLHSLSLPTANPHTTNNRMASTINIDTSPVTAAILKAPYNNDWPLSGNYNVLASIEIQRALSIWLSRNDTKPSQHAACLDAVFNTAVFKTVVDLRAFAAGADFARRGVVYECPTNGARIQNMCIEIFVDEHSRKSSQPILDVEWVLSRCPSIQCLTIEVFSEDAEDGEAVREQLLAVKGNGQTLLSELSKRSGSLVSIEPAKYLANC